MNYEYHPELHIASVHDNALTGIKVLTTVQCPGKKQPCVSAFLGARYSRSADSVVDIAKEVEVNKKGASERLANIYGNYGHASVAGLAHVPLYIENIPLFLAFKIFNWVPTHDGQERSTRYQDFSTPNFVKLPPDYLGTTIWDSFYFILNKQVADYNALYASTYAELERFFEAGDKKVLNSRTLDTTRYLLPSGLLTSMSLLTCAREWGSLVGRLEVNGYIENELAKLIKKIFCGTPELTKLGYVPEINELFKYRGEKQYEIEYTQEVINILNNLEVVKYWLDPTNTFSITNLYGVEFEVDYEQVVQNYLRIVYPGLKYGIVRDERDTYYKIGKVISKFNNHKPIGELGKSASITFQGYMDLGAARDVNRHRSLIRHFPIINKVYDMHSELSRQESSMYTLCPYLRLEGMSFLAAQYKERLEETYELINNWYTDACLNSGADFASEFVKYLLPLAHATPYSLGGDYNSFNYFCHTRHKPGGHIAYREYAYAVAKELGRMNPFYAGLYDSLNPVDCTNKEQFFDRS